jgi:hypothetical protein
LFHFYLSDSLFLFPMTLLPFDSYYAALLWFFVLLLFSIQSPLPHYSYVTHAMFHLTDHHTLMTHFLMFFDVLLFSSDSFLPHLESFSFDDSFQHSSSHVIGCPLLSQHSIGYRLSQDTNPRSLIGQCIFNKCYAFMSHCRRTFCI